MNDLTPLSQREKQVLMLICQGLSNKQIAAELNLTLNTVNSYVVAIFRKLNVSNRASAVVKAIKYNLCPVFVLC
ncbi:MAG: response regulator transcription factor [Candidatus Gastranaerophilales bacterium]|nr:response regulator transcription factor [Candidatus Gastranaerophilales bacterium]